MNEQTFVENREPDWLQLTRLCDRAETSLAELSSQELREMVRLYRKVSTDLALARTRSSNIALIEFLNDLAGRTYGVLYRAPKKNIFTSLAEALVLSAQTMRRCKWFVLVSAMLFFGSGLATYGLLQVRPDVKQAFIPAGMDHVFDGWKSGKFEERSGSTGAMMTGMYASNNPRVAIISGAVGAGTFGTLSLYMNIQNGALLGVLAHELAPLGRVDFLLSSVAPHGVFELSGIIVSCAAGLLLGWSLINPGRRSRGDSLKAVGKDAIVLLSSSVIMMFMAAPIEGFFSFNPHVPGWLKVTVALVSFTVWITFWSTFGRSDEELRKSPSKAV